MHFHICVIDGVLSQDAARKLRFHRANALEPSDVAAIQTLVRHRVLRLFERADLLSPEAAENMREWRHGGGFWMWRRRQPCTPRRGVPYAA